MKILHKLGYVHNDLKPANILVGFKDPNNIYLIDFGIAHKFLKPNGTHISSQFQSHFVGNFMFASFNACKKKIQTRRDDIVSLMIFMVHMLNGNKLPWSNFKEDFKE